MDNTSPSELYPPLEPFAIHHVAVGEGHTLYVEECGNPQGIPVVFLHGGPGSYCKAQHRSFFNPQHYHIILFDQRGAGRSTPTGNVRANTTQHLLADMEVLRQYFRIEQWLIFGGSWGATLGLLYAIEQPKRVLGLILRGTFLARLRDLYWFYHHDGVARLFPEAWNIFAHCDFLPKIPDSSLISKVNMYDLLACYNYFMQDNSPKAHQAALAWSNWAGTVISMGQFPALTESSPEILQSARIECYYMNNLCFIEDEHILNNLNALTTIPAILIHGQQDLVCPLESAYQLHQVLPNSQLTVLPQSGHLSSTPAMLSALVQATDEFSQRLL
ncbi:prolyl aminopeptidase [Beggiatoa leptomitoformis]|uniref:Proline iminopeptidase n=1 Tax=Beggiatoa leptomitoformis TaxID=288004 RepID=A0A2N9YGC5_9GAMM|nr:prolyl aminopeptidase [Beggiatoa leptomitoformis]ALG68131.1 prolyl aminopeptidase [Beggiatoa leptomitoformis]AUI69572.1 prolyl aminopeptidase [Beggiatoa leptomitoformis]